MKKPRVMMVCGFGLGSSMILKLTVDGVLKENGLSAETFCADATTATGEAYDMVFTSKEMANLFKNTPKPVVVIENFLSKQEVLDKGLPVLRKLIEE
jgi:PTS system ascorbate-specific IIB component